MRGSDGTERVPLGTVDDAREEAGKVAKFFRNPAGRHRIGIPAPSVYS